MSFCGCHCPFRSLRDHGFSRECRGRLVTYRFQGLVSANALLSLASGPVKARQVPCNSRVALPTEAESSRLELKTPLLVCAPKSLSTAPGQKKRPHAGPNSRTPRRLGGCDPQLRFTKRRSVLGGASCVMSAEVSSATAMKKDAQSA